MAESLAVRYWNEARRAQLAESDHAPTVMFCAYCGRCQPWLGRRHRYFWPSTIYAECWPCAIAAHQPRPEPWWWRWLAARVWIEWGFFGRSAWRTWIDLG